MFTLVGNLPVNVNGSAEKEHSSKNQSKFKGTSNFPNVWTILSENLKSSVHICIIDDSFLEKELEMMQSHEEPFRPNSQMNKDGQGPIIPTEGDKSNLNFIF